MVEFIAAPRLAALSREQIVSRIVDACGEVPRDLGELDDQALMERLLSILDGIRPDAGMRFSVHDKPVRHTNHRIMVGATKRWRLVKLLSRAGGATPREIMDSIGIRSHKDVHDQVRLLHKRFGYGLREDRKTGKIRVIRGPWHPVVR